MNELSTKLNTCGRCGYIWNRSNPIVINVQRELCSDCMTAEDIAKAMHPAGKGISTDEYSEPAGWKSYAGQYSSYWE